MAKILVLDDEIPVLNLIKNILEKDNHIITKIHDSKKIFKINLDVFDLILLDIMMPDINGLDICKKIRTLVNCPILFLTAKTMEKDIVYGLGIGADDYIPKPFGASELRSRINAHLRRENREKRNVINVGDFYFDLFAKEISLYDTKISFTKSEYAICEFLALHRGQVFSKEQIYEKIFGYDKFSDNSTITEHIKNIRMKISCLDNVPIKTVWGIGYKWD